MSHMFAYMLGAVLLITGIIMLFFGEKDAPTNSYLLGAIAWLLMAIYLRIYEK
jgi:peptidoglycan/LPS O-acetylase OafA/YrhL